MQDKSNPLNPLSRPQAPALEEGKDFYYDDDGAFVFTAACHLKRGYCCNSGCRHCPYSAASIGSLESVGN